MRPIAIIGAGIAGLSAATALQAAGRAVQLFDKSRGSGGRMASKRGKWGSLDLGTPCFAASDPDFIAELARCQARGEAATWQPHLYNYPDGPRAAPDSPAGCWVGAPRMSALTRGLLGDTPVTFDCRISALTRRAGSWYLTEAGGAEHGPFAQVILAVPAPQAVPLLAAAPGLASLAASVAMTPAWVVAAAFDSPLDTPVDVFTTRQGPLARAVRNSSKPGRDRAPDHWVLHADAGWSARHLEQSPEPVIAHLLEAFAQLLERPLPAPFACHAHRWRYAQPEQARGWGALSAASGLHACGDWCLDGTVEAAWLSGRAAAQQALARV
ncbi:FAD-dependent oxidoreductase [Pseudomonas sp.]|uniref:NAD(P)/FAD-dependent oxidoreductase n=1 Tax=Pseudomonas sp. TaxID=306 RepID=UPI0028AB0B47|nr:FAD-dependent oxidoreductase [Pseudomonas sp.]